MAGNEMDLLKQAAHTLMARFVMAILPLPALLGGGATHTYTHRDYTVSRIVIRQKG
jgi:hypothetical protein